MYNHRLTQAGIVLWYGTVHVECAAVQKHKLLDERKGNDSSGRSAILFVLIRQFTSTV